MTFRAGFPILFTTLMNREALDKWCERGILGLMLAILVFGPLATGGVREQDFLVLQGLTLGVILLWTTRLWLNPRSRLLWPPICWAVVAFALYAIVRYFTAELEYVARLETVRVLVYAFLFFAIVNNLHRQESMHVISFTLLFLAIGIAGYAIYQFVTGSNKVWTFQVPDYQYRGSGTYISPNHLGGFLEMILPLGLAWMLVSRAKALTRVFAGYASLVLLVGIAVTGSRGSWISTGLSLLCFFGALAFHRTFRLPALVSLAVMIGAGFFLVPRSVIVQMRAQKFVNESRENLRYSLWTPAMRMWREHPWWGVGPAHFDYRFGPYRPEIVQRRPDRVHNDYLNTLVDWGVAGTALVAAAWALLWVGAFKTWRFVRLSPDDLGGRQQSNRFAVVLGASAGLAAILAHSFVDFNMHIPANAILAVTLMAILSSCSRFATERYWYTPGAAMRIVLLVVLVAGLGGLGWQGARHATERVWLIRAQRAPAQSFEHIAALEKAFAIEPMNFDTTHALGEAFRTQSWLGGEDHEDWAKKAMVWFERGIRLNPHDQRNFMRYGQCLDRVGEHDKAAGYFKRAVELDPNGAFVVAHMGWHYVQTEDYAAARAWFERSRRLERQNNRIADSYLEITTRKLAEGASDNLANRLLR